MDRGKREVKEKFDSLFAEWKKVIQDPRIQLSSRPSDYLDNEPYREIVKMGRRALPFVIEKLEQGAFLLNQAVVDITGIKMEEIISRERRFIGEREKSKLLIKWWKSQKQ